jgi:hypothetical protein
MQQRSITYTTWRWEQTGMQTGRLGFPTARYDQPSAGTLEFGRIDGDCQRMHHRRRARLDSAARLRLHRPMRERPNLTPAKEAEHAARNARLAAALRENLQRRKEQARGQAAGRAARGAAPGGLSDTQLSSKSGCAGEDIAD